MTPLLMPAIVTGPPGDISDGMLGCLTRDDPEMWSQGLGLLKVLFEKIIHLSDVLQNTTNRHYSKTTCNEIVQELKTLAIKVGRFINILLPKELVVEFVYSDVPNK